MSEMRNGCYADGIILVCAEMISMRRRGFQDWKIKYL